MKILVIQETDWLIRGPHTQHHIFETLSIDPSFKITVLDYDMDNLMKSESRYVRKHVFTDVVKAVQNSQVKIVRTSHLKIPFLRRITSLITNFIEIVKIVRKSRPDLVVAFSITNGIIGLLLSKFFKIPFIFFYIDILHQLVPLEYVRAPARIACQIPLKLSDKVLVHTKFQSYYVKNEGAKPEKVAILPDGINLKNTNINQQKLSALKDKFSISNDDFVIFFMGYLYDFAGLKEIIEYYDDKVKDGSLKMKFLILGDGGVYQSLKEHVRNKKSNWVILAGRVPFFEIAEYIELADLCLLSFKINDVTKEIVPIKIFEYMAMKKPVLSNGLPGVVLELKKSSDVIFTKNFHELIEKIGELALKKEELKDIGFKGYEFVKENYAWPILIKKFKKIALEVIRLKNR